MSHTVLLAAWVVVVVPLLLAQRCHQDTLHHCTCLNVSHSELQCPDTNTQQFLFQTLITEAEEVSASITAPTQ